MQEMSAQTEMSNSKEISISGIRAGYMAKRLQDYGATLLRIDNGIYVFVDDDKFNDGFIKLQREFYWSFYDERG